MSRRFMQTPPHELAAIKAALPFLHTMRPRELELLRKTTMSAAAAIPAWPSYTGVTQLVGASPLGKVTVYVDPTLGQPAVNNATHLIMVGDEIAAHNDAIFGTVGGNVNVIIFALGGLTNGQGGADHMTCDYVTGQNIEVDFDSGAPIPNLTPRPDPLARTYALFEAELSECSMKNNLCGVSTGEALSRWCAITVAGNVIPDYGTASTWLLYHPDWVNQTNATDRDNKSIGCGMVFLSWLQSKNMGGLGIPLSKIAQAMVSLGSSATLADLYHTLTGKPKETALLDLQAAMNAAGGKFMLAQSPHGDDPFNALNAP